MADFSSTIHIQDEFSAPLKDYTKEMLEATDVTSMFKDSIVDGVSYMKDFGDQAMEAAIETGMELIPSLQDTASAARDVGASLKSMFTDFGIESIKDLAVSLVSFATNLYESGKRFIKLGWEIGKVIFMWKNGISMLSVRVTSFLTEAMVNGYKKAFSYVNKIVGESIEPLNLEDKMVTMWGDAGKAANQRMYRLANELGENASELMQSAAKAAASGIGTDDFEDIYRFADKIAKLNPGDTTADVAQTLVESIRNSHDASALSNLFGGGELMTRELQQKGYERKLNHGDLQGALNIAKEVAEKAGYTQEKYEKAGRSMSNDFKYINNVIENIKRRLHEIYARRFEPIVHKIAELMRSERFQSFIRIVEGVIAKIGDAVSTVVETLIDNWQIFAFMVGAMITSKVLLVGKLIGVVFKFRGIIWTVIKAVFMLALRFKGLIASMFGLNVEMKKLNMSTMASAGKYLVIAGLAYSIYKAFSWASDEISKATGRTTSWKGVLAGFIKSAQNGFQRLFTWIEHKYHAILREHYKEQYDASREKYFSAKHAADIRKTILQAQAKAKYDLAISNAATGKERYELYEQRREEFMKITEDYNNTLNEAMKDMNHYGELINGLIDTEYEPLDKGVAEAVETEGQNMIDEFSKFFKELLGITDDIEGGVKTNTDALKRMTEQEEELRWLKAFSDRQIMSRYGMNTSNTYNRSVTFNGMSQSSMNAHARSYAGFPSRAR